MPRPLSGALDDGASSSLRGVDVGGGQRCEEGSHLLTAAAGVLELVGEAVAAVAIGAGLALGAALPRTLREDAPRGATPPPGPSVRRVVTSVEVDLVGDDPARDDGQAQVVAARVAP